MRACGKGGLFSIAKVVRGKRPKISTETPEYIAKVISRCWKANPEERFSNMKEILNVLKHGQKILSPHVENDTVSSRPTSNQIELSKTKPKPFTENAFSRILNPVKSTNRPARLGIKKTKAQRASKLTFDAPLMSSRMMRLVLMLQVVGYSVVVSFPCIVFFIVWSAQVQITRNFAYDADGGRIEDFVSIDPHRVLVCVTAPYLVSYGLGTTGNVGASSLMARSGARLAIVPFILTFILPAIYIPILAVAFATFDAKYYFLDFLCIIPFILLFVVCDISMRNWCVSYFGLETPKAPQIKENKERKPSLFKSKTLAKVMSEESRRDLMAALKRQGTSGRILHAISGNSDIPYGSSLETVLYVLVHVLLASLFPFIILPNYFGAGISTRIALCLIVHPLLLSLGESFSRIRTADSYSQMEMGYQAGIDDAHAFQPFKVSMALFRRFMLLNVGEPKVTMLVIILSSVEEALMRGFLVETDTIIRRITKRPPLKGKILDMQRRVWACDIVLSSVSEYIAIIMSSFLYLLLEPRGLDVHLGYLPGVSVNGGLIFVQLVVEIALELIVDGAAFWSETEHQIPLATYFTLTKSLFPFLIHVSGTLCGLLCSYYAFLRYPSIFTCSSNVICDCTSRPQFSMWYSEACQLYSESGNATNSTVRSHDEYLQLRSQFEGLDVESIAATILSLLAVGTILALSVRIARQKRENHAFQLLNEKFSSMRYEFSKKMQLIIEQKLKIEDSSKGILSRYCIPRSHIRIESCIGRGANGEVWVGYCNGAKVAVKSLYFDESKIENAIQFFKTESQLMVSLQDGGVAHPNIAQLLYVCWESELSIVLEYYPLGSLDKVFQLCSNSANPKCIAPAFSSIAIGICQGMQYLHDMHVLHRDLKPANVLIDGEEEDPPTAWTPRITDFGYSRHPNVKDDSSDVEGTGMYLPPECARGEAHSTSSDIYSFGMLLIDMASYRDGGLQAMWRRGDTNNEFTIPRMLDGDRPAMPAEAPQWLKDIAEKCWNDDPARRPRCFLDIKATIESCIDN